MKHETFDLDDYITQRKENDSEFAEGFDSGRFFWNLFLNCDTGFAFLF